MKKTGIFVHLKSKVGFTLLELLVVTAILGILIGVSTSVFIGILRSQNKTTVTNEVRQNSSFVIDQFERDIRSAESVAPAGTNNNQITLTMTDGANIVWLCTTEGMTNGLFSRNGEALTNQDETGGISIVCGDGMVSAFTISSGGQQIVTMKFSAKQGVAAPSRSDFNINLFFETTAGTRTF